MFSLASKAVLLIHVDHMRPVLRPLAKILSLQYLVGTCNVGVWSILGIVIKSPLRPNPRRRTLYKSPFITDSVFFSVHWFIFCYLNKTFKNVAAETDIWSEATWFLWWMAMCLHDNVCDCCLQLFNEIHSRFQSRLARLNATTAAGVVTSTPVPPPRDVIMYNEWMVHSFAKTCTCTSLQDGHPPMYIFNSVSFFKFLNGRRLFFECTSWHLFFISSFLKCVIPTSFLFVFTVRSPHSFLAGLTVS